MLSYAQVTVIRMEKNIQQKQNVMQRELTDGQDIMAQNVLILILCREEQHLVN